MKIRWKRMKSPEAAARAYLRPMGKLSELLIDTGFSEGGERIDLNKGAPALQVMAEGIRAQGMWGYADTKTGIIRYWHDGKRTARELATLFGHELGHLTGQRLKGCAEEKRADMFGAVAAAVVERLGAERHRATGPAPCSCRPNAFQCGPRCRCAGCGHVRARRLLERRE